MTSITRPVGQLHSDKRADCLGISQERWEELNWHVLIGVCFLRALAEKREDTVQSISALTNIVYDTFQPKDVTEDRAMYFALGSEYERKNHIQELKMFALNAQLEENNPELFAKPHDEFFASYQEYYTKAKALIDDEEADEEPEPNLMEVVE